MKNVAAIVLLAALCNGCSKPADPPAKVVATKQAPSSPGKKVFDQWCAACHAPGPRHPGTASLAVKYGKDMPAALEERTDLTPEVVALFVRKGVMIMPPFRKTEITDAQLHELGEYLAKKQPPSQ